MKSRDGPKSKLTIPHLSVVRFLKSIEERAWTEAEKELDIIRQKSEDSAWTRGYVKALEGLLLTNRTNNDKYLYLPRALNNRSEEIIASLRRDFAELAANELHGEYDRGYFKALEDYLGSVSPLKTTVQRTSRPLKEPGDSSPERMEKSVQESYHKDQPDDIAAHPD